MTTRLLAPVAAVLLATAAGSFAQPAGEAAGALDDRAVLNPLAEISVDSLTGFRDRPLFTPFRRPPAPPEVLVEPPMDNEPVVDQPVVEVSEEAPAVTLSGVLEIDSEAVAMLRDDASGATRSVRVGDPVESWTVAAIGADSVTLELDGREHAIRIFQPGASSPPAGGDEAVAPLPDGSDPSLDPSLDPTYQPSDDPDRRGGVTDEGAGTGDADFYDPETGEGDPYASAVGDGADGYDDGSAMEPGAEGFDPSLADPAFEGDPALDEGIAIDGG
jgi:hypothetical protein